MSMRMVCLDDFEERERVCKMVGESKLSPTDKVLSILLLLFYYGCQSTTMFKDIFLEMTL